MQYILMSIFSFLFGASIYVFGYINGADDTEQAYQKKVIEAVEAERKIQEEKDEQRKAALRDAGVWRSKYERLLQSKRAEPHDIQTCIGELDRCRDLEKRCYGVIGRAVEGFDRIRIEYGDGKQTK